MTTHTKTPTFNMLVETQELLNAARKLPVGGVLPTDDVEAILGRTGPEAHGLTQTVRRALLKENIVVVYRPKHLGGLKRLTDMERVEHGDTDLRATTRKLRRTAVVVAGADDEGLDADAKLRKVGIGTVCHMMIAIQAKQKKLTDTLSGENIGQPLKIGETILRLFDTKK